MAIIVPQAELDGKALPEPVAAEFVRLEDAVNILNGGRDALREIARQIGEGAPPDGFLPPTDGNLLSAAFQPFDAATADGATDYALAGGYKIVSIHDARSNRAEEPYINYACAAGRDDPDVKRWGERHRELDGMIDAAVIDYVDAWRTLLALFRGDSGKGDVAANATLDRVAQLFDLLIDGMGGDGTAGRYEQRLETFQGIVIELFSKRTDKAKGGARADKGGKHRPRKVISGAWRSAADVADDFNRAAFAPENGARKMGTCDEHKINRWDATYPDEQHKSKWGYYARLRVDPTLKDEYHNVLRTWVVYWSGYKEAFVKWRRTHPKDRFDRDEFRFRPFGRRTDIDPDRIGISQGKVFIRPQTDDEVVAIDKKMRKRGVRRDFAGLPHSKC